MTDEELVAQARQGQADAFDQLVSRHQAAVFRAALAALRSPADAEEAAQDAFVRAWSRLDQFRGDASFRTWLLSIVWRGALTRRRGLTAWLRRKAPIDDAAAVMATGRAADHAVHDQQLTGHVRQSIEALTPKLRDTLLLAQSGEYGYDEIGAMQGIPVGTVKWRVSEARRQVRQRLAALGYVDAR